MSAPRGDPTRRAALVLVIVTCIWGSTFAITKDLVAGAPPILYLVLRFCAASVLLLPLAFARPRALRSPGFARDALVIGLLNAVGLLFQVLGQVYTTASKSSFITSLNTPLTALVGLVVYRVVPTPAQRLGVALASMGLVLLTWPGAGGAINPGDLLTACCATIYAFFIVESARRAPRHDAVALTVAQVVLAALVFTAVWAGLGWLRGQVPQAEWPALARLDARPFPRSTRVYLQMAYLSLVCVVGVMLAQTWALQRLSATTAAIIYALEPVVATVIAIAVYGASEWPGPRGATGGFLVLLAVYAAEGRSLRRASPSATSASSNPSGDAGAAPGA